VARGSTVTNATLTYDPTFDSFTQAGATLFNSRQIQLGARFNF
jgi:hypothetical protein